MQEDTFRHKGMRQNLVQELKNKGITDSNVLDAIGAVPRHVFLDSSFVEFAYQDQAFPIGSGQTIFGVLRGQLAVVLAAAHRGDAEPASQRQPRHESAGDRHRIWIPVLHPRSHGR